MSSMKGWDRIEADDAEEQSDAMGDFEEFLEAYERVASTQLTLVVEEEEEYVCPCSTCQVANAM
jgi:hypothetical protein